MKITNFFKVIWLNINILWNSLFRGMKSADEKTMGVTKEGNIVDNAVEEHISENSVYADMLNGELTQEVMEFRDANYRGYKGSFDYQYLGHGNVLKKEDGMLKPNLNVYNPEDLKVFLMQDNRLIIDGVYDVIQDVENEGDDVSNDNTKHELKIERDVFPRFLIENYAKKIVVRGDGKHFKIDLYCSIYARAHRPTDSLFISEMRNIYENKIKVTDTLLIDSIEFITNACYGSKDITLYIFGNLAYENINVYDGNFVITYSGIPICNGIDLTEQYRTKEMDEKYANKSLRDNVSYDFTVAEEKEEFDASQALSILNELND